MSKQLFEMMREQELSSLFPTKKEIQGKAKELVFNALEQGENNPIEMFSQAVRLAEAINVISESLKASLPCENFEAFGLKAVYADGGETLKYTDDEIYSDILAELKEREELLKTAYKSKSEIYDQNGVLVTKVSSTPRKCSLRVSF